MIAKTIQISPRIKTAIWIILFAVAGFLLFKSWSQVDFTRIKKSYYAYQRDAILESINNNPKDDYVSAQEINRLEHLDRRDDLEALMKYERYLLWGNDERLKTELCVRKDEESWMKKEVFFVAINGEPTGKAPDYDTPGHFLVFTNYTAARDYRDFIQSKFPGTRVNIEGKINIFYPETTLQIVRGRTKI